MTDSGAIPFQRLRRGESGSTIVAALGALALTSMVVGAALFQARNRFWTSHHSAQWAQAKHAAEAGAELSLLAAQKASWTLDGWAAAEGSTVLQKTFAFPINAPAEARVRAHVSVDTISMGAEQWLRIRSTGEADISGGAVAGIDKRDNLLRKLSLRRDRSTGASLATPRATRTMEVLAAPKPLFPFRYTFASKQKINFQPDTITDSYDSSDPQKSDFSIFGTHGVYSAANRQQNGDVASLDLAESNLNNGHIWGDVLTPVGSVADGANIQGDVISLASIELPPEVSPDWTVVTQNHGIVVNTSKSITAGTRENPTRHKFTSIELTGGNKNIHVSNPAGQTESWVELWVTGDVQIDGQNRNGIKLDPGVHATIHFGGNVEVNSRNGGYAIENGSKRPENLIIRAYGGSAASIKSFVLANTDFWGVISAPWYGLQFNTSGKHIHGSFLSWSFDAANGTHLHYDEALSKLAYGAGTGWSIRSLVEVVR